MTWTPPSFTQAMSVPVFSITRWIHRNAGLPLKSISGRLPTRGHGMGPGGSGAVHMLFRHRTRVWTRYASITMSSNALRTVEEGKEAPSDGEAAATASIAMFSFAGWERWRSN